MTGKERTDKALLRAGVLMLAAVLLTCGGAGNGRKRPLPAPESSAAGGLSVEQTMKEGVMNIKWLGHSCFLINDGITVITDPYEPGAFGNSLRYAPVDAEADIVTVSHSHADHNHAAGAKNTPRIIDKEGEYREGDNSITMYASFHDEKRGKERGANLITKIRFASGLVLVHLGDQGCMPDEKIMNALKGANIVLIPVGGHFTIDHQKAGEILDGIAPNIIVPMHFKTDKVDFPITGPEKFIALYGDKEEMSEISLSAEEVLKMKNKVIILKYLR